MPFIRPSTKAWQITRTIGGNEVSTFLQWSMKSFRSSPLIRTVIRLDLRALNADRLQHTCDEFLGQSVYCHHNSHDDARLDRVGSFTHRSPELGATRRAYSSTRNRLLFASATFTV